MAVGGVDVEAFVYDAGFEIEEVAEMVVRMRDLDAFGVGNGSEGEAFGDEGVDLADIIKEYFRSWVFFDIWMLCRVAQEVVIAVVLWDGVDLGADVLDEGLVVLVLAWGGGGF